MKQGHLIIIEGMDGAGKTTSIDYIKQHLEELGHDVAVMSSWLSNPFSHLARQVVTDKTKEPNAVATLCVAMAAVNLSYYHYVLPAVHAGKTVLLDRGPRASLALQVWPYEADNPQLLEMWRACFKDYRFDLELSFVTDHIKAQERVMARSGELDRIESKSSLWHDLARAGYMHKKDKRDIIVNDSSLDGLRLQGIAAVDRYLQSGECGKQRNNYGLI